MSMLALCAALLLQAGDARPAEARSLVAAATDASGGPVTGLGPDEIAVVENGVARRVVRFEHDARPLRVALIVDTSAPLGSVFRLHVADAAAAFLKALPAGSHYTVWTTGDRPVKVVEDATDASQAVRALKRVPTLGGNRVIDAIVEAARELKKAPEGDRTAVVVVTGLGPGFSDFDRHRAVDEASQSGATFYAVTFDDERGPDGPSAPGEIGTQDYDYVLSTLAERSGGLRDSLLSAMGLDKALPKVAADLAGQYRLSYESPLGPKQSRKVVATVARPGVKLRLGSPR